MLSLVIINAVLACALVSFLCVIWILSCRVRALGKNDAARHGRLESRIEEMDSLLRNVVSETETQKSIAEARVPTPSLNLNKRSQALAMSRRGEDPCAIANALQMPKADVELLLKVQRMLVSN